MKKYFLLLLTLFLFSKTHAQTSVNSVKMDIPNKSSIFQIIEKDRVNLFFNSDEKLKIVQFDSLFNVLDSLTIASPSKKIDKIIGYSKSNDNYYIYWSNNNKKILSQKINLKDKKTEIIEFENELIKENVLCHTTINDKFYTITITKNSSILNFIEFSNNNIIRKSCDMNYYNFNDENDSKLSLYSIFLSRFGLQKGLTLQEIKEDSPTSLVFSSKKKKFYVFENKMYVTIDYYFNFTDIIIIDLINFSHKIDRVNTPKIKENSLSDSESTSFLQKNFLIQSKMNSKNLVIDIKDLNYNLINSYTINDDQEIEFRNSEIIQETGNIKSTRILDKSNQLLRKISNNAYSISCFEDDKKYYLTIGAVSEEGYGGTGAVVAGALIGGFSGVIIASALTSNYTIDNINSYANRKVVYLNCLFDNNFNHIKGENKILAFDKMRKFNEEDNIYKNRTVFNFKNNLYFCGSIDTNFDIIIFND